MKRYLTFLFFSYPTALFFEYIANTVGDGTLFRNSGWPVFFVLWYGFLYSILFLYFRNRPLWKGVVFFAILGNIVEIVVFHRSNLIVDSIIYALMGYVPISLYRRRIGRN